MSAVIRTLVLALVVLAARVALAAAAEKSLDVQYYTWHDDEVGNLLFEALWGRRRGVRVRLLLDDLNTGGLDATIAVLDAHPSIEVRLYNPLVHRGMRSLNFVTDFSRVNRRMHNKSFTADNQVSIVGGRNVANEYCGAGGGVVFVDLDVIAVGAAVRDVSREFDLHWNSASAYSAASFVGAAAPAGAVALKAGFAATRADPESVAFIEAVRTPAAGERSAAGPARGGMDARVGGSQRPGQVARHDRAHRRTALSSAGAEHRQAGHGPRSHLAEFRSGRAGHRGVDGARARRREGARPHQFTRSSAEAAIVHSGYAKRRKALLRSGVRLFEMKATARAGEARRELQT